VEIDPPKSSFFSKKFKGLKGRGKSAGISEEKRGEPLVPKMVELVERVELVESKTSLVTGQPRP